MKPTTLGILALLYVGTAVAAAYIIYRLGWNGNGGSGPSTAGPQSSGPSGGTRQVIPTAGAGRKVTGGYIPGAVAGKISYN